MQHIQQLQTDESAENIFGDGSQTVSCQPAAGQQRQKTQLMQFNKGETHTW